MRRGGGIGRRARLKISWYASTVWVRLPPSAHIFVFLCKPYNGLLYFRTMRNSPEAFRRRTKELVLATTEAYFLKSQSLELTPFERFSHIIEIEEARMSAKSIGVTDAEIVQIYIPIMPPEARQDYFSTVIRKCDISLREAINISKRFGLQLS